MSSSTLPSYSSRSRRLWCSTWRRGGRRQHGDAGRSSRTPRRCEAKPGRAPRVPGSQPRGALGRDRRGRLRHLRGVSGSGGVGRGTDTR